MKRIQYAIISATLLTGAVSCADLLDMAPSDQIASGNMWTSPELAVKGMNGLYETFYNRDLSAGSQLRESCLDGLNKYGIEALGFCTDYYSNNFPVYMLYSQNMMANDIQVAYEWKFGYNIVHATNDAIANLYKAGLDEATYQRYICEARFLRAWAYSRLNKFFWGVPLYLEPVTNEECTRTQSSAEDIWQTVIDDLTYCIDNEYMPDNTLTENFGRPSKGAAYALRGMAYMWKALTDNDGTTPEQDYTSACADFDQVDDCGYDLWDDGTSESYLNFFKAENERDNEMIFAIQFSATDGYSYDIQQAVGPRDTWDSWDEVKPSTDFVDYFQNADGTPFSWSEWAQLQCIEGWDALSPQQRSVFFFRDGLRSNSDYSTIYNQARELCGLAVFDRYYLDEGNEARIKTAYDNRDPRLKMIVVTPYEPKDCYSPGWNNNQVAVGKQLRWPLYERGADGNGSGKDLWLDKRFTALYIYNKYVEWGDPSALIDRRHCHIDFPLIRYTDVLLQWAEAEIELGRLGEAADKINQVRDRAGVQRIQTGSQEEMREAVRYERRVEFAVEAVNYFDEIRWGTYKESKFQGQDTHGGSSWWGDNTVEYPWYWKENNWPWSVPLAEYQRNPNLIQRSGWIY